MPVGISVRGEPPAVRRAPQEQQPEPAQSWSTSREPEPELEPEPEQEPEQEGSTGADADAALERVKKGLDSQGPDDIADALAALATLEQRLTQLSRLHAMG